MYNSIIKLLTLISPMKILMLNLKNLIVKRLKWVA